MHAVARHGPLLGLMLLLLVPLGPGWAVTAGVGADGEARRAVTAAPAGAARVADRSAVRGAPLQVGHRVPDLAFPALDSDHDPIRLSEYRGKVVFLDFWSSWCAPCRRAMPYLDALRQEFAPRDFAVVGVNVDLLADDARRFLEKVPVRYPMAADPGGIAARRLGVGVLPALFLIDRQGVVREALRGTEVTAHERVRASLTRLIAAGEVQ